MMERWFDSLNAVVHYNTYPVGSRRKHAAIRGSGRWGRSDEILAPWSGTCRCFAAPPIDSGRPQRTARQRKNGIKKNTHTYKHTHKNRACLIIWWRNNRRKRARCAAVGFDGWKMTSYGENQRQRLSVQKQTHTHTHTYKHTHNSLWSTVEIAHRRRSSSPLYMLAGQHSEL